jgi:hypothetical protein
MSKKECIEAMPPINNNNNNNNNNNEHGYLSRQSGILWVGWSGFDSRHGQDICLSFTELKTGSVVHPGFHPMDDGTLSSGVKQVGREAEG